MNDNPHVAPLLPPEGALSGFGRPGTTEPAPLLHVDQLHKRYTRGWPQRQTTFSLEADFRIDGPSIVGVMGANGAGKTTLFELITGSNLPTAGRVLVDGQDIHQVRYQQRSRVALHYHQSYQVRSFTRTRPNFMLEHAASEHARIHLFDEPQFNTQDGYIGFMLDFFRRLRSQGKLVFLCLHPNERVHMDILNDVCERFIFVHKDEGTSRLMQAGTLTDLARDERVRRYLGRLAPEMATAQEASASSSSRTRSPPSLRQSRSRPPSSP